VILLLPQSIIEPALGTWKTHLSKHVLACLDYRSQSLHLLHDAPSSEVSDIVMIIYLPSWKNCSPWIKLRSKTISDLWSQVNFYSMPNVRALHMPWHCVQPLNSENYLLKIGCRASRNIC
jgi:hypothetical protein